MSGPIEVGQVWMSRDNTTERAYVTGVRGRRIEFKTATHGVTFYSDPSEFAECYRRAIPLRIRVGVTADGQYAAASIPDHGTERLIRDELPGPVVAWHWITAEVPMPEVEQGETKGEVEHG